PQTRCPQTLRGTSLHAVGQRILDGLAGAEHPDDSHRRHGLAGQLRGHVLAEREQTGDRDVEGLPFQRKIPAALYGRFMLGQSARAALIAVVAAAVVAGVQFAGEAEPWGQRLLGMALLLAASGALWWLDRAPVLVLGA